VNNLLKVEFAFCLAATLYLLPLSALALDSEKQAVIDNYEQPFTTYLAAIKDLGVALENVKTGAEFVKAADSFCDKANKFVDEFNENKERFANSAVVKSMDDDPDSKKAMNDYLESLKEKLEDAKPIFDKLVSTLNKYPNSTEIDRIRDRVGATFQRLQLLYM
jgi:lysyl-tRNA synthetase class I